MRVETFVAVFGNVVFFGMLAGAAVVAAMML